MAVATTTSSSLLAKLANINWCYSVSAMLQGINSNLLVKYIVEENAYAIMVSDFSSTYFECCIGEKIEEHFNRFNNKCRRLSYKQILEYLAEMLKDLRTTNSLVFDKIQVDCHTSRITAKTSKQFRNLKLNWNFYIISTEPDIFMRHFSLPVWRGLMHFYQLSQGLLQVKESEHGTTTNNNTSNNNNSHNNLTEEDTIPAVNTMDLFPCMVDDALLKEIFR